jgi:hypothetical protein
MLGIFKAQDKQLDTDFAKKEAAQMAGTGAELALASGDQQRIQAAKLQTEIALANTQSGASATGTAVSNLTTGFGMFGETMNDQLKAESDQLIRNLANLNQALGLSAEHQNKTLRVMKDNTAMGGGSTNGTTRGTPNVPQLTGAAAVPG